jgi:hypothetical protein
MTASLFYVCARYQEAEVLLLTVRVRLAPCKADAHLYWAADRARKMRGISHYKCYERAAISDIWSKQPAKFQLAFLIKDEVNPSTTHNLDFIGLLIFCSTILLLSDHVRSFAMSSRSLGGFASSNCSAETNLFGFIWHIAQILAMSRQWAQIHWFQASCHRPDLASVLLDPKFYFPMTV